MNAPLQTPTRTDARARALVLCQEFDLPIGRAPAQPARAVLDALAASGLHVVVRTDPTALQHDVTGLLRPWDAGGWEIIVGAPLAPAHRDLIILSLLARLLDDVVPPEGLVRGRVPATPAEAHAHDVALALRALLTTGRGDGATVMSPTSEAEVTPEPPDTVAADQRSGPSRGPGRFLTALGTVGGVLGLAAPAHTVGSATLGVLGALLAGIVGILLVRH